MNPIAQQLATYFQGMGYNPAQISAALAAGGAESSFRPTVLGDNNSAFGIWQWHGDRQDALRRFSAARGIDYRDPLAQAAFFDHELRTTEKTAGNQFFSAQDPQSAAVALLGYERPSGYSPQNPMAASNAKGRVGGAVNYYNMLTGGNAPANAAPIPVVQAGLSAPMYPSRALGAAPAAPTAGGGLLSRLFSPQDKFGGANPLEVLGSLLGDNTDQPPPMPPPGAGVIQPHPFTPITLGLPGPMAGLLGQLNG